MPCPDQKVACCCCSSLGAANVSRLNARMWTLRAPDCVSGILCLRALHASLLSTAFLKWDVWPVWVPGSLRCSSVTTTRKPSLIPVSLHWHPWQPPDTTFVSPEVNSVRTGSPSVQCTAGHPVPSKEPSILSTSVSACWRNRQTRGSLGRPGGLLSKLP